MKGILRKVFAYVILVAFALGLEFIILRDETVQITVLKILLMLFVIAIVLGALLVVIEAKNKNKE